MVSLAARPGFLTGEGLFTAGASGLQQAQPALLSGESLFTALAAATDLVYGVSTVTNGVGVWRFGSFTTTLPSGYVAITESEFDTLQVHIAADNELFYPGHGGWFFDMVGGVLTSTPDTRPTLRAQINANPVFLTVDDDFDTTIAFEVLSGGVVDTTYNQELDVEFDNAKILHLKFVSGVAQVVIDRSTVQSYTLTSTQPFQLSASQTIHVYESKLKEGS